MKIRATIVSVLILSMDISPGLAQEIISVFGRVYAHPQNGPGYFQPISNVLNNALSMHWQSQRPQTRLRVGLSLVATQSFIPDRYHTFDASYMSTVDGQRHVVEAPTVLGQNEALVVTESNGYSHVFPGGFEYRFISTAVPQLSVEGIWNSAASLRFITFTIDEQVGRFSTFGLSVWHHFAPYFELESTILAVSAGYEDIKAGDIWDASHHFFQLTGGRYGSSLHFYGSLGFQWFTQSIRYEEPFENFAVQRIDIPANNRLLLKLGAGYQWSILSTGLEVSPLAPFTVGLQLGVKL